MSVSSKIFSAVGKLVAVVLLLAAFGVGMTTVVYMSLSGAEVKVPEIVGKDFVQSEKELAALGLKIKKRAERPSTEKINTVLEQSPKPGEVLKTGNMIFVVVSKASTDGEAPALPKQDIQTDDSEKIEEMISEKPKKKANSNSNKKKADTTRDTNSNSANSSSDDKDKEKDDKKTGDDNKPAAPKNKDASANPAPRPQSSPQAARPGEKKPAAGDTKPKSPAKP